MKRTLLGLIAAGCLLAAVLLWLAGYAAATATAVIGNLVRIGAVLGVLWLAWPQFDKLFQSVPRWLLVAFGAGAVVVAMNPWLIVYVAVTLAVLWFVAPRTPLAALLKGDSTPRRRVPWARKAPPPALDPPEKRS